MKSARGYAIAAWVAVAFSSAGCTPPPPVDLAPQFKPPFTAPARNTAKAAHACSIAIADVRDLRVDRQEMGSLGGLVFRQADATAWVRSGLQTLDDDEHLTVVDPKAADLILNVELLKAYVLRVTGETSSINVVVRVRYSNVVGTLDDKVYRGVEEGMIWFSPTNETQSSFDVALSKVVKSIAPDAAARCSPKPEG